jgi:flagellar assembly protein FliH
LLSPGAAKTKLSLKSMSRILKSVHFVARNSITLDNSQLDVPPLANFNPDESLAPDPDFGSTDDTEAPSHDVISVTMLREAQEHVELMLNQAQVQVTTWQEEARREGWEAGYAEARQAIEAELSDVLASARHLAEAAVEAHDRFLRDNQTELGGLAVAVAEKIIGKELTLNPKAITDIVATAIKAANIRGACLIRVNPKDYEIIEPYWSAIPSLQPPGHLWELIPDPRVNPGGCLIEVGGGTIDAQLETQLEQAALALQL